MGKYFGTDGVRGEANKELTPELAFKLGRCGGYVLSQHEEEGKPTRVSRAGYKNLRSNVRRSADFRTLSVGIEVFQLGVISTPGVAYLTRLQKQAQGS